ncbi:cupin domain-containing protein [Planctomicrobium sp. SH668]|uniref:cupin domain-containing protein n=1 Tax=Planctomicrobium sp. SH668 TaxID=3448126 RepID=UPI003F5C0DE3
MPGTQTGAPRTANSLEIAMKNMVLPTLLGCLLIGVAGMTFAHVHDDRDGESVRVISAHDIQEKLDGHDAAVTAVEVTIEAGQQGVAHRHPGPGLVYVLEGTYELGIDDQPVRRFKAGETFYEPTGCLHRVSRNPSATGRTRLIAFVLHPRESKEIAIPETSKGEHQK